MLLRVFSNGEIEFPITVEELQQRFPHTSFADPISSSALPDGYWYAHPVGMPPESQADWGEKWDLGPPEWDGKNWVRHWKSRPLTESELETLKLEKIAERNRLLALTDWTQLNDIPEEISQKSREYRQKLRDITKDPLFPFVDLPEF